MRRRVTAASADETIAIRFAWWAAFCATLTLIAVLGIARSAQALTVPATSAAVLAAPAPPAADLEEEEAETSEDEGSEGEECEEDAEECEEEEGSSSQAPPECLLSSAEPSISASAGKDRVRLQIRYSTSAPTTVAVDYGLHGGKGSLYLGGEKAHLSRQGVLRLTRTLTEAQMDKVLAAKSFTVRLRVPAAPGYCKPFFDHQLDIRHATPGGLVWQQSK